jgi:hypothetical protein
MNSESPGIPCLGRRLALIFRAAAARVDVAGGGYYNRSATQGCWGGVARPDLHNDSLPGVRSVMERMDIRGMVFSNTSELPNKVAQIMSVIK